MDSVNQKLDRLDERMQKVEQKMFNGISDTLSDLKAKLPHLMTTEEHERLEAVKLNQMHEMAKKKDRNVRLVGALMPVVTALLVWVLNLI